MLKEENMSRRAHIVQYHMLILACVLIIYNKTNKKLFLWESHIYRHTYTHRHTHIHTQQRKSFYMKSYSRILWIKSKYKVYNLVCIMISEWIVIEKGNCKKILHFILLGNERNNQATKVISKCRIHSTKHANITEKVV